MSRRIDLSTLPRPDKKRRRASWFAPAQRFWVRNPDGGIVRILMVTRYDDEGCSRDYMLRLAANDPRPRGIELCKAGRRSGNDQDRRWWCRNYSRVPFYQWVELEYAAPAEAPKPPLLLTWPDMKGAA